MRRKKGLRIGRILTLLLCVMTLEAHAGVSDLVINQMTRDGAQVSLYVSAYDKNGELTADTITTDQIRVASDQETYEPEMVEPSTSLQEGKSYLCCVDLPSETGQEETDRIRRMLTSFVETLEPDDQVLIIQAGGQTKRLCEMTQDQGTLKEAVASIEANSDDGGDELWPCIEEAFLAWQELGLTGNRAVVLLLSGGGTKDAGDEADRLRLVSTQIRIPVYVLALGEDTSPFTEIGRFAKHTGGGLFAESSSDLETAFLQIMESVSRAYKITITPGEKDLGRANISWRVFLTGEDEKAGTSYVYSLKQEGDAGPEAAQAESETKSEMSEDRKEPSTDKKKTDRGFAGQMKELITENLYIVIAAGMVLVALVILIIVLVKNRGTKRPKRGPGGYVYDENAFSSISSGGRAPAPVRTPVQSFDEKLRSSGGSKPLPDRAYGAELVSASSSSYGSEQEKTIDEYSYEQEKTIDEFGMIDNEKTVDSPMRGVRVAFHISFSGHTQTVERIITDKLVLGRGSQCNVDVVFGMKDDDAKQTSREHAVIIYRPDGLYVQDNQSRNGTSLNGRELHSQTPLRNEDVLQLGKSIVQVRIDQASL